MAMATLHYSLQPLPLHKSTYNIYRNNIVLGNRRQRARLIQSFSGLSFDHSPPENLELRHRNFTSRRDLISNVLLSIVSLPTLANAAFADTDVQENFRTYEDEKNKFQISVPQSWSVGVSETDAIRSITAFYPQQNSGSNVSVVISGLSPDFTKLGSFGTADAFAENLVNGMDRSWKNPPGVVAKLINVKAANGLYYFEYTLQNPGESRRHIISAVGIGYGTWYNRLYTVNGQFMEDESENYRSKIERSVSSFKLL